ncbi:MAG: acetyl-CoA carboxylase carboxyl transferase subunit beta, partial [Clostridiales bacterium]|nr:acetyl-CoA carboxylase carboxyl transferase subunit beta [Clostridiales bacterium]
MLKDLFGRKKYTTIKMYKDEEKNKKIIDMKDKDIKINKKEISARICARDRINAILDEGSFIEYDKDLKSANPLDFPDYNNKLNNAMEKSQESEGVITGEGKIKGQACIIAVMDPNFMMGSMGSVVGEKITRAIERATEKK